jgi:heme/copper-type cytochrome/quinol oxidase subunit 3
VTLGVVALAVLFRYAVAGELVSKKSAMKAIGLYWHFVDVVWIGVFSVVYLRTFL